MLSYARFSEKSLSLCRYLVIITAIAAPISTAVSSIASIGLLITWLLSGTSIQTLKISFQNPVGQVILLFVVWLLIGALYADTEWPVKITTLLSWKKQFFIFILLGIFYQEQWQRRFVVYYVIAMTIAGIAALLCWALQLNIRAGATGPGIIMTNHSTQSIAFVAAFLCCIFLVRQVQHTTHKYYVLAAGLLFLFNIFFISTARSGYLALPPAAFFACVYLYGYKRLPQILLTLLGIVLIAALSSATLRDRFTMALNEQNTYQSSSYETSVGIRMIFYKNTVELIKEKPILGYGTSSFEKTYSALAASKYQDWRGGRATDPHNQYLFIWLENGLIGLLLFFAYIVVAIRAGMHNQPYGPIASSFLVAICASSLFNSHFKTFAEGNLLAFFLGTLLAFFPSASRSDGEHA